MEDDEDEDDLIGASDLWEAAPNGSEGESKDDVRMMYEEEAALEAELRAIDAERDRVKREYDRLVQHGAIHEDAWYGEGLIREPRLRCEAKGAHMPFVSEMFNNVAFANAFSLSKVAHYLVIEEDMAQYALYFAAFWTAWTLGSEYGARYNDTDLLHKVFWAIYGMLIISMLMHTSGGIDGSNAPYFCLCNASISLLMFGMTARVSLAFNRREAGCTVAKSAAWHSCVYVLMALSWATAAYSGADRLRSARVAAWTLAVLLEPVGDVLWNCCVGESGLVPLSEKYLVSKFTGILIMQLSVNITAAAASCDPAFYPAHQRPALRIAALSCYVHFVNFKLLSVDVDSGSRLRDPFQFKQSPARILYRLQQPVLIALINAAAAGMARLLQDPVVKTPSHQFLPAHSCCTTRSLDSVWQASAVWKLCSELDPDFGSDPLQPPLGVP